MQKLWFKDTIYKVESQTTGACIPIIIQITPLQYYTNQKWPTKIFARTQPHHSS